MDGDVIDMRADALRREDQVGANLFHEGGEPGRDLVDDAILAVEAGEQRPGGRVAAVRVPRGMAATSGVPPRTAQAAESSRRRSAM